MSNQSKSTWSPIIKQLIFAAEVKGVKFRWGSEQEMGKGVMGFYNPRAKCIVVRKGMTTQETEETIVHEVAHVVWDFSLKGKQLKRKHLKSWKVSTNLFTWISLIFNYWNKKKSWKEEKFAFYMQKKPSLVLHLLLQL